MVAAACLPIPPSLHVETFLLADDGLTLHHGNGQTGGQVNRLNLAKRQGYRRAKVDLLRKRVLAGS